MPDLPPNLDDRTLRRIMQQLLKTAKTKFDAAPTVPRWQGAADYSDEEMKKLFAGPFDDAGLMLSLLFARLLEITLERLNQVPEKNLFAFLETMGVSLLLPSPATAPLTFAVTDGQGPAQVPQGTQAGTQPGGSWPVLFETEQALTVVPARIVQSVTIDPNWDRFAEQTALLKGQAEAQSAGFTPFAGGQRMPHLLYLGSDTLLNFRHAVTLKLIQLPQSTGRETPGDLPPEWRECLRKLDWQGKQADEAAPVPTTHAWEHATQEGWTPLTMTKPAPTETGIGFTLSAPIGTANLLGLGLEMGLSSRWLRASLPLPLPDARVPKTRLSNLALQVSAADLLPEAAFANSTSLDVSRVFLPFGDLPKIGDAFFCGSDEAFGMPGASVTLTFTMLPSPDGVTQTSPAPTLSWEYLSELGWRPLSILAFPVIAEAASTTKATATDNATQTPAHNTASILSAWNRSKQSGSPTGTVVFTMPTESPAVRKEVNGTNAYWIRISITAGDYGKPPAYRLQTPDKPSDGYVIAPGQGNLDPPRIKSVTLSYTATCVPEIVTQNGFLLKDQKHANKSEGFAPFISVRELVPTRHADTDPAFYLGFDAAFPQESVTLYAAMPPRRAGSVVRGVRAMRTPAPEMPAIEWEYFNGTVWKTLSVSDHTNNLTEPGTLDFLTPTDLRPLARFDLTECYWIRARVARNDPFATQQVAGLFLNTVPATQAVWVDDELLGSASGLPGQSLTFARTPILTGQEVLVREKERPSTEEAARIEAEEGANAILERANPVTGETEIWVCWHEVSNFILSDSRSRHYTLDHTTGLLRFGDGNRGLIPVRDTQNIRATYQTGGGVAGNVPAASIVQVSASLPGIASVTNPLPAEGGAALETPTQVRLRGPQTLKHRYHAMSAEDMEWLAREAGGTQVARIKSLPNINRDLRFEPGWVTLIVVPQGSNVRPAPGATLAHQIEEFVEARASSGLVGQALSRINVIGPGYIEAAVCAEIAPRDMHETQSVRDAVQAALATFFHPLTGGRSGQGWEFGRNVYESEVAQLLQSVPGVNHIKTLTLQPNVAQNRFTLNPPYIVPTDWAVNSAVRTQNLQKAALLAEPVPGGKATAQLLCKGFKEGDRVTVAQDLLVTSLIDSRGKMQVKPIGSLALPAFGFPSGSLVSSFDGARYTRLTVGLMSENSATLSTEQAVFKEGDILTVFYPFPLTLRAVRKEPIILTVAPEPQPDAASDVTVVPFDTDAVGLPAGSRVQKVEALFESERRSWLETAVAPNKTRQQTLKLRQEIDAMAKDASKKLKPALKPGDILHVYVPVLTLEIEAYEAEGPLETGETPAVAFPAGCLMTTLDNRVRLPLAADVHAHCPVTVLQLTDFADSDTVFINDAILETISAGRTPETPIPTKKVLPVTDVVYVDDNYLVYSGNHAITMVVE